jgi:hypothetical protein
MERLQLNIRMDGKQKLLEDIKNAAETGGESLNAFCVRVLSEAVYGASVFDSNSASMGEIEALLESKLVGVLARLEAVESAIAKPSQEDKQPGKYRVRAA